MSKRCKTSRPLFDVTVYRCVPDAEHYLFQKDMYSLTFVQMSCFYTSIRVDLFSFEFVQHLGLIYLHLFGLSCNIEVLLLLLNQNTFPFRSTMSNKRTSTESNNDEQANEGTKCKLIQYIKSFIVFAASLTALALLKMTTWHCQPELLSQFLA